MPSILAIFVLSGAAGLIYEIVWSRQLVLVFGNTTQAVSAILTGFFGGIAIGSRGRRPDRRPGPRAAADVRHPRAGPRGRRPPDADHVPAHPRGLSRHLPEPRGLAAGCSPSSGSAWRSSPWRPATILMGATLPTLTRYLARDGAPERARSAGCTRRTRSGRSSGRSPAGFVLIELLGLTGALVVGAGVLGRRRARGPVARPGRARPATRRRRRRSAPAPPTASRSRPPAPTPSRPALVDPTDRVSRSAVAFVSGLTSLGYQVLWTRLLASGTGNSTYVFTMILAMFLIGIAIGARPLRRRSGRGSATRSGCSPPARSSSAALVLARARRRHRSRPHGARLRASRSRRSRRSLGSAAARRPAGDDRAGPRLPGRVGAARRDDGPHAGARPGRSWRSTRVGAIIGSFVVPFVAHPAARLAASLVALLAARQRGRSASPSRWRPRRSRPSRRWRSPGVGGRRRGSRSSSPRSRPGVLVAAERGLHRVGGRHGSSTRPRTRSRRSRPARSAFDARALGRRHVDDAAHRRRQADADPAADRPARVDATRWSSRSGWARRSGRR